MRLVSNIYLVEKMHLVILYLARKMLDTLYLAVTRYFCPLFVDISMSKSLK